jgi:hypothetical protein
MNLAAAIAVASTMYFEAADQGHFGRMCQATVMWNEQRYSGKDLVEVVKNPNRYSCWGWSELPKRIRMRLAIRRKELMAQVAWNDCWEIACSMLNGTFQPVGDWTNYCRVDSNVWWKAQMTETKVVADHIFGKLG